MAVSASASKNISSNVGSNDYSISVSFSESSTSIANNTSTISITGKLTSKSTYFSGSGGNTLVLWWKDNNANTSWKKVKTLTVASINYQGTKSLSGSLTVTHKSDGSLSGQANVTWTKNDGNNYTPNYATLSTDTKALTKIARASTPTLSSSSLILNGTNSVTINTNRASNSFTHTITYKVGSISKTLGTGVGASIKFTPSFDLIKLFNTLASIACTITCITYNGSTNLGSKTVTLTLTNPGASKISINTNNTFSVDDEEITINIQKAIPEFRHEVKFIVSATGDEYELGDDIDDSVTFDVTKIKEAILTNSSNTKSYTDASGIYSRTYLILDDVEYTIRTATYTPYTVSIPDSYAPSLSEFEISEMADVQITIPGADVVRYISKKKVSVKAEGLGNATISSAQLTNGSQTVPMELTDGKYVATLENLTTAKFNVVVSDSRSLTSSISQTGTYHEYELPVITSSSFSRDSAISSDGKFTLAGGYWDGEVGGVENSLTCTYTRNDISDPRQVAVNHDDGTYYVEALQQGLIYSEPFTLIATITDKFNSVAKKELSIGIAQWTMWIGKETLRVRNLIIQPDAMIAMYDNDGVIHTINGEQFKRLLWDDTGYVAPTVTTQSNSLNSLSFMNELSLDNIENINDIFDKFEDEESLIDLPDDKGVNGNETS